RLFSFLRSSRSGPITGLSRSEGHRASATALHEDLQRRGLLLNLRRPLLVRGVDGGDVKPVEPVAGYGHGEEVRVRSLGRQALPILALIVRDVQHDFTNPAALLRGDLDWELEVALPDPLDFALHDPAAFLLLRRAARR